jgi:hypothetical protein
LTAKLLISGAHASLQRRCYWLLDGDDNVVLVHYLSSVPHANRAMVRSASSAEAICGAVCLNAVDAQPPPPAAPQVCVTRLLHAVRRMAEHLAQGVRELYPAMQVVRGEQAA